ncbi:MAG TPA: amidohydrolase family protein [Thermoanaerobaculia bacterium]|nr:amidohydrolase family protein [Thermoanaerobaculia bacterium]
MQGRYRIPAVLLILLALPGAVPAQDDVAAARALFEKNLQAIRDKDRDAYLSCYLQSDGLVRTGPDGFQLGYKGLEATAGEGWPDHISADDLRLTPIRPGVVYGSYRYRVRYGKEEVAGISERLFLQTPQGWKIAVSTAFPNLPGVPPPPRALAGATLVDSTGGAPVPDSVVIVRDGKIDCAGPRSACPIPEGIDTVDLRGHWIAPGLIDAHVHFSQTGWADGRPDSIDVRDRYPYEEVVAGLRSNPERFGRSLLCSGVTAAFDVGGYPWTIALSDRFEPATDVPRVSASGPLLATVDHELNLPGERQFVVLSDADSGRSGVRYLKAQGADAVKVWFIPTREKSLEEMSAAVRAAGEEARRLGLPLVVHATGLAEAKEALRAGAKLLVHSVDDQPVDQEFLDLAKSAGTVYCPTLTVMSGYLQLFGGALRKQVPAFEDPNNCVDSVTRARIAETAQIPPGADLTPEALEGFTRRIEGERRNAALNLKKVRDAGIPIAMGTDAGNPMTLHGPSVYVEMEAMQAAGLTPMQVLVASTHGGALAMGRDKEIGTVEKGKLADLVILSADPTADIANLRKLRWVVRGGTMRSIEELSILAK